jgi:hypothetical protein
MPVLPFWRQSSIEHCRRLPENARLIVTESR